jgi:hypothetical protein
MWIMKLADTTSFLLKLLFLFKEAVAVLCIADTDCRLVVIALGNTFHEELFDGYTFFELDIRSHVGIAKAT